MSSLTRLTQVCSERCWARCSSWNTCCAHVQAPTHSGTQTGLLSSNPPAQQPHTLPALGCSPAMLQGMLLEERRWLCWSVLCCPPQPRLTHSAVTLTHTPPAHLPCTLSKGCSSWKLKTFGVPLEDSGSKPEGFLGIYKEACHETSSWQSSE